MSINKKEFVKAIADASGNSESGTKVFLETFIQVVQESVASGKEIALTGFGTFKANHRAGYIGKSPKTGLPIQIAPSTIPSFKAGSKFRAIVSSRLPSKKAKTNKSTLKAKSK